MTGRTHTVTRWSVRVAALAVTAAAVPLFAAGQADAATVTCKVNTQVFATRTDGTLDLYQHTAPSTGAAGWSGPSAIGSGWQGRTLPGVNGDVYNITTSGELHLLHYDLSTHVWANNGGYTDIGSGWSAYTGAGANLITVDGTGTIYIVDSGGLLRSYYYNPKTRTWDNPAGTVLDAGWSKYTRIFSSGPGVVYAVDGNGNLFRYRYDPASQRFTEYADQIGNGWQSVQNVFSPGGDVIYAIDSHGTMFWYRFNDDTQTWDNNAAGKAIGSGWLPSQGIAAAAATVNTCTVPDPAPVASGTPIAATPADPIGLGYAQSGQPPFYLFEDANGHANYAQDNGATGLNGPVTIPSPVFAGSLTTDSQNSVVSVVGLDATGQAYLAQSTNLAAGFTSFAGSLNSLSVTHVGSQVLMTGVDGTGQLWGRWDADGKGHFVAWRSLTAGPAGLAGELNTTTENGGKTAYGVAAKTDGTAMLFTGDLSGNASAGVVTGSASYNLPVPAAQSAAPTLFATDKAAGGVSMIVPAANGTGTWAALPALADGVTAKALSATSVTPNGTVLAVAALGSDGNVYVTNETTGTTFGAWQKIGTVQSTTAPTITYDGNVSVDLAFRGQDGNLYHYNAAPPATGAALAFTGGAHTPSS